MIAHFRIRAFHFAKPQVVIERLLPMFAHGVVVLEDLSGGHVPARTIRSPEAAMMSATSIANVPDGEHDTPTGAHSSKLRTRDLGATPREEHVVRQATTLGVLFCGSLSQLIVST